ncbi:phosphotransferase [Paenibacillus filicis]|uniref:Phosphotransferase n=1 Tax=Paenibacillus gyeongsangnamensis TaxID=3388067 RepID=A0ABT4QCJ9_9BACL|nr:phosphotransferase [Paenibacillus filicis]MCZ8514550.1 phosphotransferase [Paenibacillus filicis]
MADIGKIDKGIDEPALPGIIRVLQEQGVLDHAAPVIHELKGTTDGRVYTLASHDEPQMVLKLDRPESIRLTEHWLNTYRHVALLPKLLYTDPTRKYIVYSYLPGTTHRQRGSKKEWLMRLVRELFNYYVICDEPMEKWGWMESPSSTWREFIDQGVEGARANIGSLLTEDDYRHVKALAEFASRISPQTKLFMHGDTGVHNFVFHCGTLTGVIDPSPVAGPARYDMMYAFCSSPDELTLETFLTAYACLQQEKAETNVLIAEITIQLYCRIGICLKYHSYDLEEYLQAWDYWKALSLSGR